MIHPFLLSFALVLAFTCPLAAQEAVPVAPSRPSTVLDDPLLAMTEGPAAEFKLRLAPKNLEELEEEAANYMAGLETVSKALVETIIAYEGLVTTGGESNEATLDAAREQMNTLREVRNALATRTNMLLEALEAKGGEVEVHRNYLTTVQAIEPEVIEAEAEKEAEEAVEPAPVVALTEEEIEAQEEARRLAEEKAAQKELEQRVLNRINMVREMPPVHERSQPWTVSKEELELELQPLRRGDIQERLDAWVEILQREVRNRIRMDIALRNTEDEEERGLLAEKTFDQQEVIAAIVDRIDSIILIYQKRGGDASEYGDYITNATGQRINLTNPSVLLVQSKAWATSPGGGILWALNHRQIHRSGGGSLDYQPFCGLARQPLRQAPPQGLEPAPGFSRRRHPHHPLRHRPGRGGQHDRHQHYAR
jgi:hypothetical protein